MIIALFSAGPEGGAGAALARVEHGHAAAGDRHAGLHRARDRVRQRRAWASSLGAAIVLAAALAPTDPVLAGDIGIGPPGEEDEHEPHFAITAEAGFNDGLAFPFVLLGLVIAEGSGAGRWIAADLVYPLLGGALIGAALGTGDRVVDRPPARPRAADPGARRLGRRRRHAGDLRHRGDARHLRLPRRVRRRPGVPALRARPRAQRPRARRRRDRREVRGARGDPAARLDAHRGRARDARPRGLGPGRAGRVRAAPADRQPRAARLEDGPPRRARVRGLVRRARRGHAVLRRHRRGGRLPAGGRRARADRVDRGRPASCSRSSSTASPPGR